MEDLVSICFPSVIVIKKAEHLKMGYWKAANKRSIAIAREKVQMLQGLFKSCLFSLDNLPSRIMKALYWERIASCQKFNCFHMVDISLLYDIDLHLGATFHASSFSFDISMLSFSMPYQIPLSFFLRKYFLLDLLQKRLFY